MEELSMQDIATKAPSLLPTTLRAHSSQPRLQTSSVVTATLSNFYPTLQLTITNSCHIDLLGFAREGHASLTQVSPETHLRTYVVTGQTRTRGFNFDSSVDSKPDEAKVAEDLEYAKFLYKWEGHDFLLFIIEGQTGLTGHPEKLNYILAKRPEGWTAEDGPKSKITHELMLKVAEWMMETKEHVLVFDEGRWKKNSKLWEITKKASWDNVVLGKDMKSNLKQDVEGFFDSRAFYEGYKVPWKRGIIFHGPPGNGKTMALQALMQNLYARPDPIPTLYVKSFAAENGAQWSIRQIFVKARQTAPCLLVFEDIDSMVVAKHRSYFLNEVDGLESNDGIFMLGTTNHLDRLDPALAHRPSRFDRKIHFERPSVEERAMYARFWRGNIPGADETNFPEALCSAIADITEGYSFAYLKELFLATLMGMAREGVSVGLQGEETVGPVVEDAVLVSAPGSVGEKETDSQADDEEGKETKETKEKEKEKVYPELQRSILWPLIKVQAEILRTAIVNEDKTGRSEAALGEKGIDFEDDSASGLKKQLRMLQGVQRAQVARYR